LLRLGLGLGRAALQKTAWLTQNSKKLLLKISHNRSLGDIEDKKIFPLLFFNNQERIVFQIFIF
jgi:hypothetical protein